MTRATAIDYTSAAVAVLARDNVPADIRATAQMFVDKQMPERIAIKTFKLWVNDQLDLPLLT